MDKESDQLAVWRWLAGPEGERAISRARGRMSAADVGKLRRAYSAEQVHLAAEVATAREKAHGKLDAGFARRLIADVAGVEMASSALASAHKARRFARVLDEGALVADLCCGIGGDWWGLAQAGLTTVGVDRDRARAWMYGHNTGSKVVCADALAGCPDDARAFHLDPARRSESGQRTLSVDDFEPGPGVWDAIIEKVGHGAIKLNPGVDGYALPQGELEILSEPGGLTQAVLWVGDLAGEHERRATKLGADGSVCTIGGGAERPGDSSDIGAYIGTLDPCLERADLVGAFLEATGTRLVHPGTGLVTGETAIEHTMVRWYRVVEVMAWGRKRVRAALRGLEPGVVEIRTRGGVVNPDEEQKALRGKGTRDDVAVLVYRIGGRVMAVIARGAGIPGEGGGMISGGTVLGKPASGRTGFEGERGVSR